MKLFNLFDPADRRKLYAVAVVVLVLLAVVSLLARCGAAQAGMSISAGNAAHTHSDANTGGGTLALSGSLTSTKACASGYTRRGPNLCLLTSFVGGTALTRDACTAISAPSADAVALLVQFDVYVKSGNNAGIERYTDVGFMSDAGCSFALPVWNVLAHIREFSAVATGTTLLRLLPGITTLGLPSPGATIYFKMADDAANSGTAEYYLLGYLD